jgi:hypothetical protein
MIDQFYVERSGKNYGPFSAIQLKTLASTGKLRPTDAVWKLGMVKAVLAANVKNLFPSMLTPPCPLAVPAAKSTEAASSPISSDAPALSYLDGSAVSVFVPAPPKERSETFDKNARRSLAR